MPPWADIIQDVIHRDACPLDFRATTTIDDLRIHWTPRLSYLMPQRDPHTSGAHRAVPDMRLGHHVAGSVLQLASARQSPCLGGTLSVKMHDVFCQRLL